jgi:hypothetical protein
LILALVYVRLWPIAVMGSGTAAKQQLTSTSDANQPVEIF